MQAEAAWLLFKYLLVPLVLAGLLFGAGYKQGEKVVQTKFDAFQQAMKETSDAVVIAGLQRENEANAKAEEINRKIEEQANVHNTQIDALTESNRTLLHERMLRDAKAADCPGPALPKASQAANLSSAAADPGRILLSEDEGLAIINAAKEADELIESLRACRSYIESLQN